MNTFSEKFLKKIFFQKKTNFHSLAIELFNYQANNNKIYADFINFLNLDTEKIKEIEQIPFLPIRFFKNHRVATSNNNSDFYFSSSSTSGIGQSKHYIRDIKVYEMTFNYCFKKFFRPIENFCILGLLPSYLEREGSSLVFMVDSLIQQSNNTHSGFYLNNFEELSAILTLLKKKKQKTILLGVTYALIDFAKIFKIDFEELIIIETGGMKGRKKEIIREELQNILKNSFINSKIYSEYGMTELMSQAYKFDDTNFLFPNHVKVFLRNAYDPLEINNNLNYGGLNIIDLANIDSCAFIATDDIGKIYLDGSFKILGRFDDSDIRGCSLLY